MGGVEVRLVGVGWSFGSGLWVFGGNPEEDGMVCDEMDNENVFGDLDFNLYLIC